MLVVIGTIGLPLILLFLYKIIVSLLGHHEIEKRSNATEFEPQSSSTYDPNTVQTRYELERSRKEQLYNYYTTTFNEQLVGQACLRLLNGK